MADIPECPLWVKSGHVQRKKACPLYPRKRTCALHYRKTQGGVIPGSRLFAMLQHTSQNISAPETDDATARKYARGP